VSLLTGELPGQEAELFADAVDQDRRWFVLHTRSRQEKALIADLGAMGVAHFLPLITQARYFGNRKLHVELPLFPSYVFVRGSLEQVYLADRTKRLVSIIRVPNQHQLNWELRNLHLALANQVVLDPYPMLRAGVRVEVRAGPLRGLQGVVESRVRANRLILQIEMLGQAVSVEVEASLLDPIT
jgi:transcription antitermination factor NusG